MTVLVLLVILYCASLWFARGVEKNIRILTKNYFPLTHYFMKALLSFRQRTAPPQIQNCTPLRTEVAPPYTVSIKIRVICQSEQGSLCSDFLFAASGNDV